MLINSARCEQLVRWRQLISPLLDPTEFWQTKGAPKPHMLAGKRFCCNATGYAACIAKRLQLFDESII
jgi:hypothetical protein